MNWFEVTKEDLKNANSRGKYKLKNKLYGWQNKERVWLNETGEIDTEKYKRELEWKKLRNEEILKVKEK
jgi:hypothetical protein